MVRNLDISALRSFVMVADLGGITRAANSLHRTQSAVSMQLKRLEVTFDRALLEKSGRTVRLTPEGEVLASHARRLLALNDDTWRRMTEVEFDGEIALGAPHDIISPAIPEFLKRFRQAFPRVRVNLVTSYTAKLIADLAAGDLDVILTTETDLQQGGEVLSERDLIWVGAEGGQAWKQDPLPLAFERVCAFRKSAIDALDAIDRGWRMAVDTQSDGTVYATIAADLGVRAVLEGSIPSGLAPLPPEADLPDLPRFKINLYKGPLENDMVAESVTQFLREGFAKSAGRVHRTPFQTLAPDDLARPAA